MSQFWIPSTVEEYDELGKWLDSVKARSLDEWIDLYRWYSRHDLFFLVNFIGTDKDTIHSQLKQRFYYHDNYIRVCRKYERQKELGGGLDCSGRGIGKSTLRTKWLAIQYILSYPDISIFIFSVERQLAKKHLRIIKDELTSNVLLKALFDDILYQNPQEAAKLGDTVWSLEDGLRVKRTMIRSTQTVEMHSFFGGGPVGTRPDIIMFDDIERRDSVGSPEKIQDLEIAYGQGIDLLTPVAIKQAAVFVTNTRFSEAGLIQKIFDQYMKIDPDKVIATPGENRAIPGDGPLGGSASYPFTIDVLWQKYNETPDKADYALQFALDYVAGTERRFDEDRLCFYREPPRDMCHGSNAYICIDTSRGVDDPTVIWTWALRPDRRKYLVDLVVKRMDPTKQDFFNEIWMMGERLKNYGARLVEYRVERTGQSIWPQLIEKELRQRGDYTTVRESVPPPTKTVYFESGKQERIWQRLGPGMDRGDYVFPLPTSRGGTGIVNQDDKGLSRDVVDLFISTELRMFPRSRHDDMLDAASLIEDERINKEFPLAYPSKIQTGYSNFTNKLQRMKTTWMSGM